MTKARDPVPTVAFIDDYSAHYRAVFPNVRQFGSSPTLTWAW
jgi:hypothetical protein